MGHYWSEMISEKEIEENKKYEKNRRKKIAKAIRAIQKAKTEDECYKAADLLADIFHLRYTHFK